jgi:hypothetical protein
VWQRRHGGWHGHALSLTQQGFSHSCRVDGYACIRSAGQFCQINVYYEGPTGMSFELLHRLGVEYDLRGTDHFDIAAVGLVWNVHVVNRFGQSIVDIEAAQLGKNNQGRNQKKGDRCNCGMAGKETVVVAGLSEALLVVIRVPVESFASDGNRRQPNPPI